MADSMFGTPIGHSQADMDLAKMALTNAQVQHMGMQDLAMPSVMAQRAAQARFLGARSDALERQNVLDQALAQRAAVRGPGGGTGENPSNFVWDLAQDALALGDPNKAVKFADKAASIDRAAASADTNRARASFLSAREEIVRMDTLSRSMRAVGSPDNLRDALIEHEAKSGHHTGMLDQNGQLIPQVAENWEKTRDFLQEQALSERDRRLADYRQQALDSAERERSSKQQSRTFWQDMRNQEDRAAAQAKGRGQKSGGNILDKEAGVKAATSFINSKLVVSDADQGKYLGRKLAERAKEFKDRNPALSTTEALEEAFKSMQGGGSFEGILLKPAKADPNKPLPLPTSGDQNDLRIGQYYNDGKAVRQWLGPDKGWGGPRVTGKIGGVSASPLNYAEPEGNEDQDTNEADQLALAEDNEEE